MSTVPFDHPFNVFAPAKLNIRLKITGKRSNGYHELVSLMVPVDLFDHLVLKFIDEPRINVTCRGFSAPANADNLVCRATKAFFSQISWQKGLSIELNKRIPVAAGLGGGSSDAAAILMALNETLSASRPLSQKILTEMALNLGADVPFFLRRGPCIAHGIGEILEPVYEWPSLSYVIVMPDISVSTAWAYKSLGLRSSESATKDGRELELTKDECYYMIRNSEKMPMEACRLLENDLERVTMKRFPVIKGIKKSLTDAGAIGALMSGSGPSVFGIFESETSAINAKLNLDGASFGQVFVVKGINSWGVVKW